jgi:hypothetical protein
MFTDPHFNIMDGLDIYIDDYSKPDPLPPGMLERMVQSDMLNLFKKSPDEPSPDNQPTAIQAATPKLESDTLEAHQQSDLTSTQQKSSTQLEKVSNESSIEPEPKKT